MAIQMRARFAPRPTRFIFERNAAAAEPEGDIILIGQLIAYDDVELNVTNYKAGDEATENKVIVVAENVFTWAAEGLAGRTVAQRRARFAADRDAWASQKKPLATKHGLSVLQVSRALPRAIA